MTNPPALNPEAGGRSILFTSDTLKFITATKLPLTSWYTKGPYSSSNHAFWVNDSGTIVNKPEFIEISTARLANILVQNQSNINQISKDLVTISGELSHTIKSLDPLVNNMTGFSDSLNHLEVSKTLDAANQSLLALKEMTNQLNS